MALQNRVTPFGEIVATPERGTMFGNRGGCLHDEGQRLGRKRWTSERWICCLLEYKGWHREVMTPGQYTELFFLDEATAFAAGHRPCALCRRADHLRFKEAWLSGNAGAGLSPGCSISAIDRAVHRERTDTRGPRPAPGGALPDGVFLTLAGDDSAAWVSRGERFYRWSPGAYIMSVPATTARGRLLTPPSYVAAFRAGYLPVIHESAS